MDIETYQENIDALRFEGHSFCSVCQVNGADLLCLSLDGVDEFYDDLCCDCVDWLERMVS